MSWQYKPLEERIKKPGWLETAARDVGGSLAQVVGSVGQAANQLHLGAFQALDDYFGENHPNIKKIFETGRNIGKSLEDWGTEVKSVIPNQPEFQNRNLPDLLTDINFLTSPYGLWHNAWEGVGSSLPFMAVGGGLMKAGITPASWAGGAVKNALGKTQAGQKLLDLGGRFANTRLGGVLSDMASGGANYGLTTAPLDAMANSAELIKPLKDRGFSDSEIAQLMQKSVARELPMDIAANALQGNVLFGKGLGLFGKTWKGRLGYGAMNIPLEMGTEYFQEGNQTANVNKFLGLPYTENPILNFIKNGKAFDYAQESDAANAGAFGSIIPSAGGTVHHAMFGRDYNNPPQPSQDTPPENQTPITTEVLAKYAQPYDGKRMDNGVVGCVEAATKIGSGYNDFLREELSKGVVGVAQLRDDADAKGLLVPYDENNLQAGDILGWKSGDRSHVVIYDGNGGYWGNHSGRTNEDSYVYHSDKPHNYGKPDWVIKTGVGSTTTQQPQQQASQRQGNIYFGENGKGEGTYWTKQHSGVSYKGAQPQTMNAIDALGKWFYDKTGKPLVVTSVTDGSSHVGGAHSHYNGWKFDINDNGSGAAEGTLLGANGGKGSLTDEIIAYGRSLGLGMNWEGDHIDVAVDGTQWDGNGGNVGGFNPSQTQTAPAKKKTSAVADDPNFSAVENKMWRLAQKLRNAQKKNII